MKKLYYALLCLLPLLFHHSLLAQKSSVEKSLTLRGIALDAENKPLKGVNIYLLGTSRGTITNATGEYEISNLAAGNYKVIAYYLGLRTLTQLAIMEEETPITLVSFLLNETALEMDEVIVTGNFNPVSKLQSSVGITTLNSKAIEERSPLGTGDLLTAIPGNFVDNSAGEVGAQIFPRGLSTGQNNQLGFRYVSLQEDGLPVMSTQIGFGVIDMFHRVDANVARLEAIRGGSASITSANSPGGIFNFISKTGGDKLAGTFKTQGGLNASNSGLFRLDGGLGGKINQKGWSFHVGGFYRKDNGARKLPFVANQGGQLKANLTKKLGDKGELMFYGKYLNDRITFYKHIPVLDLGSREAYEGFNLRTSSTFPLIRNSVPDSKSLNSDKDATRTFDSQRGVSARNTALGMAYKRILGYGWEFKNNAKYSYIDQNYQQFQNSFILPAGLAMTVFNPVSLFPFATAGPIAGYPAAPAPAFPTYLDPATGQVIGQFSGATPVPNVPNQLGKFLFGFGGLDMKNTINDWMDNFSFTKKTENHELTLGGYAAYAQIKSLWNVDFLVSRFEPNPRPVSVRFASPYAPQTVYTATDEKGYVGYNSGAYVNFDGSSRILSAYLNDSWKASDYLTLDGGARYEYLTHSGFKSGWLVPNESDLIAGGIGKGNGLINNGGLDGNPLTTYDSRFRRDNGLQYDFEHTYQYVSGSLGFNYRMRYNTAAIYGRASYGNKAPEMDYYIQNFVNQPIEKGTIEQVQQYELGFKYDENNLTFSISAFYSKLNNILFQVFIPSGTSTVFTPPTFNDTRTIGAELECVYIPVHKLFLKLSATVQDARFANFSYYNTNGTTTPQGPGVGRAPLLNPLADDFYESFDGNKVNDIPMVNTDFSISYQAGKVVPYLNYRFVGKRYANRRNTVTLPAYGVVNTGVSANLGSITLNLFANNLLNGTGLVSFDGIGVPGGSVEDMAAGGVISKNPTTLGPNLKGDVINAASPSLALIAPTDLDAAKAQGRPFMVRPILPRVLTLSVSYTF